MRNLPNVLTVARLFLTAGFIFCLTHPGFAAMLLAVLLFMTACLSDYYDGYLAKKFNSESNFGKIMDPIADKFLVLAAFFIFERMRIIAPWMFWSIFLREVIVTGLRFAAMGQGRVLAAEQAGKYKTFLQLFAIYVILLFLAMQYTTLATPWSRDFWLHGIYILMLLAVSLTTISGISYLWNNRRIILLTSA
jgi:CDP-diacylglycerol--glycerol-3-phosphate 3-phosphatidyltransferase